MSRELFNAQRVCALLGVGMADTPLPTSVRLEESVIYIHPLITDLTALRRSKAPMLDESWYDEGTGLYIAKPGYWAVINPVPRSDRKAQGEQDLQIAKMAGYQRTPLLVDSVLLACMMLSGKKFPYGIYVRCPEKGVNPKTPCTGLMVNGDRFGPCELFHGEARPNVRSSAARWLCD